MRVLSGVAHGLFAPDRAFAFRVASGVSLFALLALQVAAVVAGETMILWRTGGTELRRIALVESRHVAEQRSTSFAEPEDVDRRQAAAYRRLTAPTGAVAKTAAVLVSGLVLPVAVVLTWLAFLVLAQFFGGEEPRVPGRPRPSIRLVAVAFAPLALRRLASGAATLAVIDPAAAAAGATTVAAFRERATVRFDLAALVDAIPAGFVERAAVLLTDPFGLWALAVLASGAAALLRLPAPRALALTAVIAALWTLFDTVAGGRWALLA
ncbi:MAG: YIP1 family protein [Spirochaetaceae bacterium]|nr:YIP1 family protein [Spirochaetaceae bacterium]